MVRNYDLQAAIARINAASAKSGSGPFRSVSAVSSNSRCHLNPRVTKWSVWRYWSKRTGTQFWQRLPESADFRVRCLGTSSTQTKAARAELRVSEEDRKAVLATVVGDVAAGYFSLLELDSELDIAKRTLTTREESLRLIRARQQGGLATLLDVRQAEELVYQASQTIPDTERLIDQTENQLSVIFGNNPGQSLAVNH
jgi:outer membrane protein TolC